MAICHGAEHGGLGVAGLERENVGGQRVHLTPVEPLEGPLGHREQFFGSEVGHRPLSSGPSSRVAARPGTSRTPAVHRNAAPAVISRMALPQNVNQSSIRSSERYEESLSLAAAPSQSWTYSSVRAAASRARSRHPSWLPSSPSAFTPSRSPDRLLDRFQPQVQPPAHQRRHFFPVGDDV